MLSESGIVALVATNLLSDHYNKTRNASYVAVDEAQGGVVVPDQVIDLTPFWHDGARGSETERQCET